MHRMAGSCHAVTWSKRFGKEKIKAASINLSHLCAPECPDVKNYKWRL